MEEISRDRVFRLVDEILRRHVIDEPDVKLVVRPFMVAVVTHGVSWEKPPPAILETYRAACAAVLRLARDQDRGLRAPPGWSEGEVDVHEVLAFLKPDRKE